MPGRKTDQADCIWLATLLRKGLIRGSFIPPAEIRALRDLCRCRTTMVQQRSQTVLRIQKLLEESNIKLDSVLTDVRGVSGRAMLNSLSEGETDEEKLAALAVPQLRGKMPQLTRALEGTMVRHRRFVLKQWLSNFEELDRDIAELEQEIEAYAAPFESQIGRLDEIPGVNRIGAIAILSEIGVDMSAFATAGKLCAWAGVCPGNNETGGKRKKARVRSGNRWLRGMLTQCAWAATRTRKSYFHAQYRKLVGRCGNNKALVAAAHSLLAIIWHMLQRNEPYRDLGADYFDCLNTQNKQRAYVRKLEQLGFKVTLQPAA
jgi:transposase